METRVRPLAWRGDSPLFREYGLDVVSCSDGLAVLRGQCREQFGNNRSNSLHGGAYGGLAACAGEVAASSVLDPGMFPRLLEYRVQIFRPMLIGTTVTSSARVLHRGRRYLGLAVDLLDERDRVCSHVTATYSVEQDTGTPPAAPSDTSNRELAPAGYPYEESPSWATYGVRVAETAPGFGKLTSAYDARFADLDGALHSAFVAAVADSVTVPTCATVTREDEGYTTIEYKVNFLAPVYGGGLVAEGRIVHRDDRVFVVDAMVTDDDGRLCAKMLTSLAVLVAPPG